MKKGKKTEIEIEIDLYKASFMLRDKKSWKPCLTDIDINLSYPAKSTRLCFWTVLRLSSDIMSVVSRSGKRQSRECPATKTLEVNRNFLATIARQSEDRVAGSPKCLWIVTR